MIQRMDNVLIVVEDLEAAKAFFAELGMELEGETPVEGPWVDRVNGLESVQVDIVMMRTPYGCKVSSYFGTSHHNLEQIWVVLAVVASLVSKKSELW